MGETYKSKKKNIVFIILTMQNAECDMNEKFREKLVTSLSIVDRVVQLFKMCLKL